MKKKIAQQETVEETKKTRRETIGDIVYICILAPLVCITLHIVFMTLTQPNVIPDVFGYKFFMIFDDSIDESIGYGDLVITHNINPNDLQVNDLIAFRNSWNTITIKKITEINETTVFDEVENENKTRKIFLMKSLDNETSDMKKVQEERVEGILVYSIPKLGIVIYFIQQPLAIFGISCIILSFGLIWIYIAQELDERESRLIDKLIQEKDKTKETV